MEKCLVSQIGIESKDESLPIFGKAYFEFATDAAVSQSFYAFNIRVLEPIELIVDNSSYFTDPTGTENRGNVMVNDNQTGNVYVKSNTTGTPIKVSVSNKYVITQFRDKVGVTPGVTRQTPILLNKELFEWSVDLNYLDMSGIGPTNVYLPECLKRLTKLERLIFEHNQTSSVFTINDLAEAQILNGRNAENPTLFVTGTNYLTKYFNGSSFQNIPHNDIYIIYKSGGYELRDQTATGTLLYDSLA